MRKRYFLSFNTDKPSDLAAYEALMRIPAAQRSRYVIDGVLATENERRLEDTLRAILRDELGQVTFAAPAPAAPVELAATKSVQDLPNDLLAMIEDL